MDFSTTEAGQWQSRNTTVVVPANRQYASIQVGLGKQDVTGSLEAHLDNISLVGSQTGANGKCTGLTTGVCLQNDRFLVETTWRDFQGNNGAGGYVELTDDTGYFWFFNPDNVEVTVKVLDGCPINNSFWVFAAAMTNVEVTLTVTDMETAQTRTYLNPLGSAFQPVQDTSAFATCP